MCYVHNQWYDISCATLYMECKLIFWPLLISTVDAKYGVGFLQLSGHSPKLWRNSPLNNCFCVSPKTLTLLWHRVVFNNLGHPVLRTYCWCGDTRQWLRGNCKTTELQSAGRCSAVACSGVAGRRLCDVLIQHQEVLFILTDWFWAWYLSFVRPWCEDCGCDFTQFATFRRYHLPPSSQCKIGNLFSWTWVHLQCRYSATLNSDMIKSVLRDVAGFRNICNPKRGKRIYVQKT